MLDELTGRMVHDDVPPDNCKKTGGFSSNNKHSL